MFRTIFLPLSSLLLASFSITASAEALQPNKDAAYALSRIDPAVIQWKETDRGIYEGLRQDGATVRVFSKHGRPAYLQELEQDIAEIEAIMFSEPEGFEEYAKQLAALTELAAAHRKFSGMSVEHAKGSQTVDSTVGDVCGLFAYGSATFTHTWNEAQLSASFPPLGSGPQFTPPPLSPVQIFRFVQSEISPYPASASMMQDWPSSAPQITLTASAGDLVFPLDCTMKARYVVDAVCHDYSTGFASIQVTRTCAEVY